MLSCTSLTSEIMNSRKEEWLIDLSGTTNTFPEKTVTPVHFAYCSAANPNQVLVYLRDYCTYTVSRGTWKDCGERLN